MGIFNIFNKNKFSSLLVYDGEYETEQLDNPKFQTHLLRYKNKVESDDYDKQIIKPGSKILQIFKYYLIDVIEKYKKINKKKFEIIMNSDEIKGEADIKILNSIYYSNQNKICICSKDSDMILIAHSLSINKFITVDVISNFRPIQIIFIDDFKKYGLDYVLIVLLLGNDYLPKISSITYKTIIKTYEKYIQHNKPIIFNNKVNHDNLIELITYFIILGTDKKIKFKFDNFDPIRFEIYINNLIWCLSHYKVISSDLKYIQEINNDDDVKLKNAINIYNFIHFMYN